MEKYEKEREEQISIKRGLDKKIFRLNEEISVAFFNLYKIKRHKK